MVMLFFIVMIVIIIVVIFVSFAVLFFFGILGFAGENVAVSCVDGDFNDALLGEDDFEGVDECAVFDLDFAFEGFARVRGECGFECGFKGDFSEAW